MQHRCGGEPQRRVFDAGPGLTQIRDVVCQFLIAGVLGIGAQDKTAPRITHQGFQAIAQLIALFRRDFLRDANVIVLRQKNQMTTCDADLGRQPRAFGANRVFDDLNHQRLALEDLAFNRHQGLRAARCLGRLAIGVALPQVSHVQKSSPFQANFNERRLHPRQYPRHFAQIHIPDQAAFEVAFHMQLLHSPMFHHSHTGFLG